MCPGREPWKCDVRETTCEPCDGVPECVLGADGRATITGGAAMAAGAGLLAADGLVTAAAGVIWCCGGLVRTSPTAVPEAASTASAAVPARVTS
jgi:hypothetical protein